jgi:hypothetical protein
MIFSGLAIVATLFTSSFAWVACAEDIFTVARGSAPNAPQQPQVAVDQRGNIHIAYGVDNAIHYCRLDTAGKSITQSSSIAFAPTISLGMRRGPRIVAQEKSLCISAIGGQFGKGRDGDLLAMCSSDGGANWQGPVRVNDVEHSAREGLHAMAGGPDGKLCCVWLDLRTSQTEIMASISRDGGMNWDKNVLVYRSPDGSVCECCHPSVAFDGNGRIHVQWRNSLEGNRDMYVASSSDDGITFGPASKRGEGFWKLNLCPMDGGAIASVGDEVVSIWRRGTSIYTSQLDQKSERFLGEGEQPWVAATRKGPFFIWSKRRGSEALLVSPRIPFPQVLDRIAIDPVVACGPHEQSPVVAAWESREGPDSVIRLQILQQ